MEPEIIGAIIGATATVGAAFAGLWYGRRPPKEDPKDSASPEAKRRPHQYDVFVSSPLAAFPTDDEIKEDHRRVEKLVTYLEKELDFRVYWAGRNIESKADFDDGSISAHDDVVAILDSKCFLLLYPGRVASSVLFEAGIALRSCLSSVYVVRERDNLPFLMKHAAEAFDNVRTCETTLPDEAIALFRRHGRSFFKSPTEASRSLDED